MADAVIAAAYKDELYECPVTVGNKPEMLNCSYNLGMRHLTGCIYE